MCWCVRISKMKQIYLAIDDDPIRYYKLSGELKHPLVVTCRLSEVHYYMKNFSVQGILLDHDMPFGDGMMFATLLAEHYSSKKPVVVVSQNPSGAKNIKRLLVEFGFNCICLPASDSNIWTQRITNFLD